MKKDVVFEGSSFNDFNDWQLENIKLFCKIAELIEEVRTLSPAKGKPEALKYSLSGCWSRKINDEHRLVYKITENEVQIISCKYHYQ